MAEEINIIRIKVSDKNQKKAEAQIQFQNSSFELTNDLVLKIKNEKQMDDIVSCTLVVGVYNIAIQITEFTLTDMVFIESFYNMPSCISILQVKNTKIHVNKQKIDLLQVDSPYVLLGDCQIRQFDAGLNEHSSLLSGNEVKKFSFDSIDIRDSNIQTLKLFMDCKSFNVQGSNIDVLNMYGSMKKDAAVMQRLFVWQYSTINVMTVQYHFESFKLEESSITKLIAKGGCFFDKMEIQDATVLDAYNISKEHFADIDIAGWSLVSKSASNQGLLDKRAEAQYAITKKAYQQERGFRKFFGKVIDFCTGFGYKPIRALRTCLIMIFASWGLIVTKDIVMFQWKGVTTSRTFLDDLRIAVTAIAGQSGLTACAGFPYWVAFAEYVGAVVLFAMFVNALYVRYKD